MKRFYLNARTIGNQRRQMSQYRISLTILLFEYVYRYELDLVIELNASTMRALEPILKDIIDLPEEDQTKFKVDNLDGSLMLHFAACNHCLLFF